MRKMSLTASAAASTMPSASAPSRPAKATSLPSARSPGKEARTRPKGVTSAISSAPSSAPNAASFSSAASTEAGSGGWMDCPRIAVAELTVAGTGGGGGGSAAAAAAADRESAGRRLAPAAVEGGP
jgi:hypothetical protein